MNKFTPPLLVSLLYAFSPTIVVFNFNITLGDLALLYFVCTLWPNYNKKIRTLISPFTKYYAFIILFNLISLLIASLFISESLYLNSIAIVIRPFLFIIFLILYFADRKKLPQHSFKFFLWCSTFLILGFSLYVLTNVGFTFSHDHIWSYDPASRLVALRGVLIGSPDTSFVGNDSVNFSIFTCLIGSLHYSYSVTSISRRGKIAHFALAVLIFMLSSLSLSKSSYLFIIVFFIYQIYDRFSKALLRLNFSYYTLILFFIVASLFLFLLPSTTILNVFFPRGNPFDLLAMSQDASSLARFSLFTPYIKAIYDNPLYILTGFGTGSLLPLFNSIHFEGLFVTILAENGLLFLLYFILSTTKLFFPSPSRASSSDSHVIALFLRYIYIPFISVSLFSSLTLYSSLIYPLIMWASYYIYNENLKYQKQLSIPTF